jgi:hypothetical protein
VNVSDSNSQLVFLGTKTEQKMYREPFKQNFSCSRYDFLAKIARKDEKIIIKN